MARSEKIKYEVDPFNRLVISKNSASGPPSLRQVLEGKFNIDRKNELSYTVKAAAAAPQRLKLSGNWSLDKEHNLVLTLDKENNQVEGEKLTLQGEIIQAEADKLTFLLSAKERGGKTHFYLLQLAGRWQADRYNRLIFRAARKNDLQDELSLSAAWEIDKKNQLVYTYTKAALKTKEKTEHAITFKGYWDINQKTRLSYILNQEIGSGFEFTASVARPLKRGLEYEIGIGVHPRKKKILLFGSWKINPQVGLSFEMPAEEGKIRSILFGADCKLGKNRTLELKLRNSFHKDLGINLKFSQAFFKGQGTAFVQALKEKKEISIFAGMGLRW